MRRRRVLVVNCYFPERRESMRLVREMPMPLAPVHLAGMFDRERCEVRIHNEISDGHLEVFHPELLSWPELIVFTGLTPAFDRMLHVSAYARTINPNVVTVAGGLAIRTLPRYSRQFFDYTCTGDVEELAGVIEDLWGEGHANACIEPRYDLARFMGQWIGYAESSRNCNFRCAFCTLTADALPYQKHSTEFLRRQIEAMGRRRYLHIADNQFFSTDRDFFLERVGLLKEMRDRGYFRYWGGFATNSFFWDEENIRLAVDSGCIALLVGVETFDAEWLSRVDKKQNLVQEQLALIRRSMDAGILFLYGLVFDPTERTVEQMRRELRTVLADPTVPAPSFVFASVPFPGTPFFRDRWERGLLLPGTKVRDLEGSTLSMRPLDSVDDAAGFLATDKNLASMRGRAMVHQARLTWRYRRSMSAFQLAGSVANLGSILHPAGLSNPRYYLRRKGRRTHVSTTDRLDPVYTPRFRVDGRYDGWFQPTQVTTETGALNEALAEDLLDRRYRPAAAGLGGA